MEKLILNTKGENSIVAHIFVPDQSNGSILLINSATGVKQQVYFSFAQYISDHGFTVITYDYSGIGLSKPENIKKCRSSMRTWGTEDYKAITDYIKIYFPGYRKYLLGHSVGALIIGMNEDSAMFEEFVFVGAQNAFVGHLNWRTKVEAYLGFGIAQPFFTALMGYFPAQWFGLGESLPKNCAYDWRILILNRKSTSALLKMVHNYSERLTQKTFVIRAEDDHWLTDEAVSSLLHDTYSNLRPVIRLIRTSESEAGKIGHINFFRSYNRKLWAIILNEWMHGKQSD
ncbi:MULTISPECIES: alpha/beta hydrolase family protein [Chryseobacterium]|uniref:Alpha/beta hydrolase n=1 Tax=Chryseobacterium camelliae TaxID=1265445 RepID=A0ABU0TDL4_9FLAO|nr:MULTISPECIES: alpha/beta fold hydrolase [Chryseobacterium]MDT3407122.1 putative alpha/beta hydrolase [Pseudacidovorax intermedius]MDQ1095087.1 putative alpha/beta hydrolase [Chryseobacterium camelliae]MDQ1099025.1 putative alpha/beta hydrolase [Chryseobacterium sp. SORGH_AS_1048]MDR6086373.1 putative alpha/beta hydrolase [Chryseobacterium sp. SORGH_AS_0909]MDR6130746.1 putative alpha/beta hydrolase [Chryseobacterium sp. SORGH_AS_1175]